EIRSQSDPDDTAPDRTFFCVGDVKQAIYGWRGGCAEIFAQVHRDLYLPETASETLSESYRSSPIVLDAVNRVFGQISDNPTLAEHRQAVVEWQNGFMTHKAHDKNKPGFVELTTSHSDDHTNNGATDDDDQTATLGPTPHESFAVDRISEIARRAPGRTIGVLVRTNKMVKQLIHLLRTRHIPASGEGGTPVTDDPAVNVILSAFTLADHPGDTAGAFHVLNSPLAKIVGLESIHPQHAAKTARSIRQALVTDGYARTITRWVKQLAPSCDRRSIARLTQLVELADAYDPALTLRAGDFVDYVKVTAVEEPSAAPIRVMTIHKAKGLEFDIVVLPELDKRIGWVQGLSVLTYRPGPTEAPAAVFATARKDARSLIETHCPIFGQAYQQELTRRLHDDLSALYVAMTRAKHALHVIIQPLKQNKDGKPAKEPLSWASILRHALCETDETFEGRQTLYDAGEPNWAGSMDTGASPQTGAPAHAPPIRIKLAKPKDKAGRSWPRVSPSSLQALGRVEAAQLLAIEPNVGMVHGNVMHKWFEQIGWLDEADAVPGDDELLVAARSVSPAADEDWLRERLHQFKRILDLPAVKQVLSLRQHEAGEERELWRERQFVVRHDGKLLHGRFDRVVIHRRDGQVCAADLIDFKTDAVTDDTMASLVEKYQPQMNAYRTALSVMLGLGTEQVAAQLLFVTSGRVCEVQDHQPAAPVGNL
ncbi:MAG: 3'-5' exonuclease, partial [Phycisphaeraceae bacterium]